jgi:arylsulfatase A
MNALRALTCLAVLLLMGGAADAARDAVRPNIVVILADDLGWADVACNGGDLHETPHTDRLARDGVRFTQAYAASPVCSPTRASLLTGKCPARLHMTIWREDALSPPRDRRLLPPVTVANLPHRETTIASLLQRAGYLTAIVGKWHLGDTQYYPETHGFDVNIGGTIWGAPTSYFFPYRGVSGLYGGDYRFVSGLYLGGKRGEYLSDRLTDEALRVIDAAGHRPFFLYLAHHAVHVPLEAKRPLIDHYAAKLAPAMHHRSAVYAAMVHSVDESVGRVLARLQERGIADPGETKNLASRRPDQATRLRERLQAWLNATGAQMPSLNPNYKLRPKAASRQAAGDAKRLQES